jgi:hypothetical protein
VRDEITRATSKDRRPAAIALLIRAAEEYAEERYRPAHVHLVEAKALAPRSATIRELLGLSAYHIGQWNDALRELRAYRRLTGETTHMSVEMDCLRGLGRPGEVDKTWSLLQELGSDRDADREARVVYASHLLDQKRLAEAWRVIKPGRLVSPASESEVRRWFVAAKVAIAARDPKVARTLVDSITRERPNLPGLEELTSALDG